MSHPRDRTLALAAVFQSAHLAMCLAHQNKADETAFNHSINSILVTESESTEAIFGGFASVRLGLKILRNKMTGENGSVEFEIARYILSLIQLSLKLAKKQKMLQTMATQIEVISSHQQSKSITHFDIVDELAQLYTQTISTLNPRIIVTGDHGYLTDPQTAARVRAILLSGVRSAFLWHQLGGRRWQLIFSRRHIGETANAILDELDSADGQGSTMV